MTFFDLILNLIRQFQMIDPKKMTDLTFEVEKWEQSATPLNENDKVKQMYGKVHQGEYGLLFRMAMPFLYFFLRAEFKNIEKEDDELL